MHHVPLHVVYYLDCTVISGLTILNEYTQNEQITGGGRFDKVWNGLCTIFMWIAIFASAIFDAKEEQEGERLEIEGLESGVRSSEGKTIK